MADESEAEKQSRLQLEEFQRQQAAAAVEASRRKPNAIPAEAQPRRAVDYAQPTGEYIGGSPIGPSVAALNRPPQEWGGPSAFTTTGQPSTRVPSGTDVVQGSPLSPDEEKFWAANQMGAVPHPVTGEWIGLGNTAASSQKVLESISPQDQFAGQQVRSPNFVPVPERDPAVAARRSEIAAEIERTQRDLKSIGVPQGRQQIAQFHALTARLAVLSHTDSGLALHELAQERMINEATHQNRVMQEQHDIHRDSTAAQIAMSRLPSDDAEALKQISKIYFDHRNATLDHATEAALIEETRRRKERLAARQAAQAQGLIEVPTGYSQRGESVKYINPTVQDRKDADTELKAYGIQLPSITNPVNVAVGRIATQADVDSKKAKNVGDFIGDSGGNIVSIDTGKSRNAHVPIDVYLKYGGQLSPADQKAQGQPATTENQQPNVTQSEYNALKSGQLYWWNGKQIPKQ